MDSDCNIQPAFALDSWRLEAGGKIIRIGVDFDAVVLLGLLFLPMLALVFLGQDTTEQVRRIDRWIHAMDGIEVAHPSRVWLGPLLLA